MVIGLGYLVEIRAVVMDTFGSLEGSLGGSGLRCCSFGLHIIGELWWRRHVHQRISRIKRKTEISCSLAVKAVMAVEVQLTGKMAKRRIILPIRVHFEA